LAQAAARVQAVDKALSGTGLSANFAKQLSAIGLSAQSVDKVSEAFKRYASAAQLASKASERTKSQAAAGRSCGTTTRSALAAVSAAESSAARQTIAHASARRQALGTMAGAASAYLGYRGTEAFKKSVVSQAEFDEAYRKQREFTGISADEQRRILKPQA